MLARSPLLVQIADAFSIRSDWPSTPIGFYFDDISSYSIMNYDDQSFYDEMGGASYWIAESYRTGSLLRK